MQAALPLISCVCVTRHKPIQLARAIDCFLQQTYPNKEMMIIFEDDDPATGEMVRSLRHDAIKYHEVAAVPKLSLGNLRNLSIRCSTGEYFCQWDDDDWYHDRRLEIQMEAVLRNHKPASLLAYWLMYDSVEQRSFLSPIGPWAGSVLCKRKLIDQSFKYPDMSKREDHVFLGKMIRCNFIYPVIMPSLYIYAYHGGNTFSKDHFNMLVSRSQQLPGSATELFRSIFNNEIPYAEASRLMDGAALLKELNYFNDGKE